MTRIVRGQITRKIRDFYKEFPKFSGNLTPKNSGHDADWDTISLTFHTSGYLLDIPM